MLKFYLLLAIALPLTQAIRLFLSNNDGWDDSNVRSLFHLLDTTTTHDLILCAPQFGDSLRPRPTLIGEDEDGEEPEEEDLMSDDGSVSSDDDSSSPGNGNSIFDKDSSPEKVWDPLATKARVEEHRRSWHLGFNVSDFRLNYVPFPLGTNNAIDRGVWFLAPSLYKPRNSPPGNRNLPTYLEQEKPPDLFLVGPKVGSSLGESRRGDQGLSAVEDNTWWASPRRPSISFAGATGVHSGSNGPQPHWSEIYAQLAKHITLAVIESGDPYLPRLTYLHVNFPHIDFMNDRCTRLSQFKFILTSDSPNDDDSLYDDDSLNDNDSLDDPWCGRKGFPFETDVVNRDDGCYVAMSLGVPSDERRPKYSRLSVSARKDIIRRLKPILSCLPDE
ncbi:hypothetical protein BDU57DRAFT_596783 [Ampelomyces quisqualis]|uniref:Uncharacterized protein n=1 Tax=Ampelomyces quisqualis TaxID=50730 RepID=A0A6A5QLP2_AMPQU|nr:hypothetical protein BDU57DRAFT_596783 [Ampelomyces quisqualis]